MGSSCGACDNQPDGIYLCPGCRDVLIADLTEVESIVEALWASAARMDVGAGSVGSSGHSAPMEPTNARAYDAGRTLNVILTGWTQALGNRQPHATKAAAVLLAQIREVRGMDWAPVLADELRGSLADCRRAMDRTAERISLGACWDCPGEVIAIAGEARGYCRLCDVARDVKAYQAHMISEAWHVQAPLKKVVRALKSSGHLPIPEKRVEKWVERGALKPVDRPDGSPPLYTPAAVLAAYRAKEAYKADLAALIARKATRQEVA
jgi:hypothetical protein